MAQVLGDDQVGREALHEFGVYRVDAFAAIDEFAHLAIDLARRGMRINTRANQCGPGGGLGGEIALVGYTDNAIARADGIQDFGGGGQERNDAHARSVVRELTLAQMTRAGMRR